MAQLIDNAKIGAMLGQTTQAIQQTTGAVSQVEQWTQLAQAINGIMDKAISFRNKQSGEVVGSTAPMQSLAPMQSMDLSNRIIPANQPQPTTMTIEIDNAILQNILMENFVKLKNLPEDVQSKTLKDFIASVEQNQAMLSAFIPSIALELKKCVKVKT
jgi:hypothetical protein